MVQRPTASEDALYYNGINIEGHGDNSNTARVYVNGHHRIVDTTTGVEGSEEQLQIIVPEGGSIQLEGTAELHADVYFAGSGGSVSSGDCSASTICVSGKDTAFTGSTNGNIDAHSQATVSTTSSTFEPDPAGTFGGSGGSSETTEEQSRIYIYGTVNR